MFPRLSFRWLLAMTMVVAGSVPAEPVSFFKPNDVIALVGGEDMVTASEYGFLEFLLNRAHPDFHLKFRSLAWEGDTVFEQPRMLNYPPLEKQLDDIGATVVLCQFGAMESMAGEKKLPEFVAAYEKLIERLAGNGKRRVAVISLVDFVQTVPYLPWDVANVERDQAILGRHLDSQMAYAKAIRKLVGEPRITGLELLPGQPPTRVALPRAMILGHENLGLADVLVQRDGIHLTAWAHRAFARDICRDLQLEADAGFLRTKDATSLLAAIGEKNRLWFNYYRPQNWAFLAGDRISQPSSHDYLDPSKRWFPDEMQQFLPLIEAKEQEIWSLAKELAPAP